MRAFEAVIGLEIHAQLLTKSKMFCACSASYGARPNTQVCPVCLGLPGALPVVNERAVEFAVRIGVATHCTIAEKSIFARKNYFYPDCPKNYQISQYDTPICSNGHIDFSGRRIGISRIHLEEDAGKLIHAESEGQSLVDMNRCGVPLIEIVTEPDIRTPQEASGFLQRLRSIVRYLEICDGNMEEGSLRCDVNLSLREVGGESLGTKTELKNLNSFRAVEQALEFEIKRQKSILTKGGRIEQATLLWNAETGEARVMRSKEEAQDYRYFPEPDLLVLEVTENLVERVSSMLPEMPDAKEERFVSEYGLPRYDAGVLTRARELADYFEAVAAELEDPKAASNWMMGEVLRELKERGIEIAELRISPKQLASLVSAQKSGQVNMPTAKEIFREMAKTGRGSQEIISERALLQISDEGALEEVVSEVLESYPAEVRKYLEGKERLLTFFIGQVMKETKGKANPQKAKAILLSMLKGRR